MLGYSTVDVRALGHDSQGSMPVPPRRHGRRGNRFSQGGVEPTIEELLTDPLTAAVMRRDGVTEDVLRSLIVTARESLLSRVDAA